MKVAVTVWENRISPVFDSSGKLLIAEIRDTKIISRRYASFNPDITFRLAEVLNDLEIEILICGAISEIPADIIEAGGIELIPFIGGNAELVLLTYARGSSIVPEFLMPGCGGKGKKQD